MQEKHLFGITTGIAVISFVLFIVNAAMLGKLRDTQAQVADRQSQISDAQRLSQVNEAVVRAMAQAAISQNDGKLRALLTEHGITIQKTDDATQGKPAAKTK